MLRDSAIPVLPGIQERGWEKQYHSVLATKVLAQALLSSYNDMRV